MKQTQLFIMCLLTVFLLVMFSLNTFAQELPSTILEGHTDDLYDDVHSVAFSPDGETLASGGRDDAIRLWDISTGNQIHTLQGHTSSINSVAFSPDGKTLASGSDDGTIRLWELPDTRVSITALPVNVPAIGDPLTLNIEITDSENVTGYQARVIFDATALRYVESANGDYLPANAFVVPPVVEEDQVTLVATAVGSAKSGDGTLATLTFEFIAVKEATVTLSQIAIVNSGGEHLPFLFGNRETLVGVPRLREDVNLDGVVNILDLQLVASSISRPSVHHPTDINEDGIVDIVDLVLVAGALGNAVAAPTLYPHVQRLFTVAEVQEWLRQAQQLNLTNPTSQRGIHFLKQLLAAFTPQEMALLPNYPNPFNPETWIPYQLAKAADITLTIYAVDGTVVRTLALGYQPIGIYQSKSRAAYWDGKNALGEPVASGIYFYTLTAGEFTATRKMLIQK